MNHDAKNITCDACGQSPLRYYFHLEPDLDLCLDCAGRIKDGNLDRLNMQRFIQATRKLMRYTEENPIPNVPQDVEQEEPPIPVVHALRKK